MSGLPAQANGFFFFSRDVHARERVARRLAADSGYGGGHVAAPGWLAATEALPGGRPPAADCERAGLWFLQGYEPLLAASGRNRPARLREISELALMRPRDLAQLPGDFAFAAFGSDGRACFARAAGGLVPLYWWRDSDCFAVATRLGDLVRLAGAPARIDPLTCAVWASGWGLFPDGRTPLADAAIVARGHALVGEPTNRMRSVDYWQPTPEHLTRPTQTRFREHASRLRALLETHLETHLSPEGGNLLTLSGGVDSTSLAALAVHGLNLPVWVWSLLPPPGDALGRELDYIRPLLNTLGVSRAWRFQHRAQARLELLHKAPPVAFPIAHPALCDLPRVSRSAPVEVLFGGEFADEICGSGLTFFDWAAHTAPWQLLQSVGRWPRSRRDALRWARLRYRYARGQPPLPLPAALPAFAPADLHAEYAEWFERQRRAAAADRRPLRHLRLNMALDAFVAMNWEAAGALGIRRCFPFFNREVLELGLACHPRELVGPGKKRLLRAAVADVARPENLMRPDKGQWQADFSGTAPIGPESLPDTLAPLIDAEWLGINGGSLRYPDAHGLTLMQRFAENLDATVHGMEKYI